MGCGKFGKQLQDMGTTQVVTANQLRRAADVLLRFFEEYQAVDRHNSDAVLEYEKKRSILIPLVSRKLEHSSSRTGTYSLVDLLAKNAVNRITGTPGA